jgi:hypothetical protein
MIQFITLIKKFDKQGEKTGWTYIEIPFAIANRLKEGTKKSFRVKGRIEEYTFEGISLLPMGGGNFIMALNATMRKGIRKAKGAVVEVWIERDEKPFQPSEAFMECLRDEPTGFEFFNTLPKSHQDYFSKWIESAKGVETNAKRIAQAVTALSKKQGYGEMIRSNKANRDELFR